MCVAKVTVPDRAGDPPVFRNFTVTFSHQRSSAAARTGSPTARTAGPVVAPDPGAEGVEGAEGPEDPPPEPPVPFPLPLPPVP
ncbi:hypothetical protein GCM10009647_040270 [Streptomyces sanglieri]